MHLVASVAPELVQRGRQGRRRRQGGGRGRRRRGRGARHDGPGGRARPEKLERGARGARARRSSRRLRQIECACSPSTTAAPAAAARSATPPARSSRRSRPSPGPPAGADWRRSKRWCASARSSGSSSGCRCRCDGGDTEQTRETRDVCAAPVAAPGRGGPRGAPRRALHHAHRPPGSGSQPCRRGLPRGRAHARELAARPEPQPTRAPRPASRPRPVSVGDAPPRSASAHARAARNCIAPQGAARRRRTLAAGRGCIGLPALALVAGAVVAAGPAGFSQRQARPQAGRGPGRREGARPRGRNPPADRGARSRGRPERQLPGRLRALARCSTQPATARRQAPRTSKGFLFPATYEMYRRRPRRAGSWPSSCGLHGKLRRARDSPRARAARDAVPAADRRLDGRARGAGARRPAEDRGGHLQPPARRHAARDRRHDLLRGRAARTHHRPTQAN